MSPSQSARQAPTLEQFLNISGGTGLHTHDHLYSVAEGRIQPQLNVYYTCNKVTSYITYDNIYVIYVHMYIQYIYIYIYTYCFFLKIVLLFVVEKCPFFFFFFFFLLVFGILGERNKKNTVLLLGEKNSFLVY